MLASLSSVLHLHISSQRGDIVATHSARVPGILLVGHGKFNVQPIRVLLDELKVRLQ